MSKVTALDSTFRYARAFAPNQIRTLTTASHKGVGKLRRAPMSSRVPGWSVVGPRLYYPRPTRPPRRPPVEGYTYRDVRRNDDRPWQGKTKANKPSGERNNQGDGDRFVESSDEDAASTDDPESPPPGASSTPPPLVGGVDSGAASSSAHAASGSAAKAASTASSASPAAAAGERKLSSSSQADNDKRRRWYDAEVQRLLSGNSRTVAALLFPAAQQKRGFAPPPRATSVHLFSTTFVRTHAADNDIWEESFSSVVTGLDKSLRRLEWEPSLRVRKNVRFDAALAGKWYDWWWGSTKPDAPSLRALLRERLRVPEALLDVLVARFGAPTLDRASFTSTFVDVLRDLLPLRQRLARGEAPPVSDWQRALQVTRGAEKTKPHGCSGVSA